MTQESVFCLLYMNKNDPRWKIVVFIMYFATVGTEGLYWSNFEQYL